MSAVEPRTVKIVEPLWSRFAYGDGKFYSAFVETDPVGFGGFAICGDGRCTQGSLTSPGAMGGKRSTSRVGISWTMTTSCEACV